MNYFADEADFEATHTEHPGADYAETQFNELPRRLAHSQDLLKNTPYEAYVPIQTVDGQTHHLTATNGYWESTDQPNAKILKLIPDESEQKDHKVGKAAAITAGVVIGAVAAKAAYNILMRKKNSKANPFPFFKKHCKITSVN